MENTYIWLKVDTNLKSTKNIPENVKKACVIEQNTDGDTAFYLSFDPSFKHDFNWIKLIDASKIESIAVTDKPPNFIV